MFKKKPRVYGHSVGDADAAPIWAIADGTTCSSSSLSTPSALQAAATWIAARPSPSASPRWPIRLWPVAVGLAAMANIVMARRRRPRHARRLPFASRYRDPSAIADGLGRRPPTHRFQGLAPNHGDILVIITHMLVITNMLAPPRPECRSLLRGMPECAVHHEGP